MNTNQNWTIDAPAGAICLSDFLTEIPANCLFNKKQTGCGATELAIRNSIPTIIAMPYVALVKNKTIYRKDDISVLGVYEGIQEQDIIDYAKSHSLLKIAVTYDSLPRTIRALETAGFNVWMFEFHFIIEFILKDTKNHIILYSRSEQADNEFYRVRGYMSCNCVAVSSVGAK